MGEKGIMQTGEDRLGEGGQASGEERKGGRSFVFCCANRKIN
jgi:hypothetical protein